MKHLFKLLSVYSLGLVLSILIKYLPVKSEINGIFVITKASDNYYIISNYFKKFYIYSKNNSFEFGDIIRISGYSSSIEFTTLESSFNFKNYLEENGVFSCINNPTCSIIFRNFIRLKEIKNCFLQKYSANAGFLLENSLFFMNSDTNLNVAAQNLNLYVLLSSSGFYISSFNSLLVLLFSSKLSIKKANIISFAILLPFYLINFSRLSIQRILFLNVLKLYNYTRKNPITSKNRTSIIAIIFLVFNPYNVYQLSYLLGFGLSFLNNYSTKYINSFKKIKRPFIRKAILYLFVIPVNISMNNAINPLSFFLQILLAPFFQGFFIFGITSLYLGFNPLIDGYGGFLYNIINSLGKSTFSLFFNSFNQISLCIIYFILIFCFFYIEKRIKKINKTITVLLCSSLFLLAFPYENIYKTSITFINVGQGDSIFLRNKKTSILFDTGGSVYNDIANNCLIPFFRKNKIYDIDYCFISHSDYDHSGALESLKSNFKVKNVIIDQKYFYYDFGDIKITNLNTFDSFDENSASQVIKLEVKNTTFLLMGDAPKEIENKIVENNNNMKIDFVKIGHHGSNTSTSDKFIKYINPKEAIISVGKNQYGHPHKETLETLKRNDVKIRRTDLEGSITYICWFLI